MSDEFHGSTVNSVAVFPNSDQVVMAGSHGSVRIWDVQTGDILRAVDVHQFVGGVAIFPEGDKVRPVGIAGFSHPISRHYVPYSTHPIRMVRR